MYVPVLVCFNRSPKLPVGSAALENLHGRRVLYCFTLVINWKPSIRHDRRAAVDSLAAPILHAAHPHGLEAVKDLLCMAWNST
jgi:hypothetical protein